ncbi:2-iminoacetate synthase ThiH [Celerinatantimonas yamalensis]|uniref:2-iminoacetate synthase ThiH n=1 Tax=Celerinatantimonas yamalensis TaxID=559956 RepID=A0ABW9G9F1_9GAMM
MSFSHYLNRWDWDDQYLQSASVSDTQVLAAIDKAKRQHPLDLGDFKTLISPQATRHVRELAQLSHQLTVQRFGRTMQLYIPLYLSNQCSNICLYCGFSMENEIRRMTLTREQLEAELDAIAQMGFEHILLVTGEAKRRVGMDYFRWALPLIKQRFANVSIEVQPLDEDEYHELVALGLDGMLCYQETYHKARYQQVHLRGNKCHFEYRLDTADRAASAGVDKIGLGALIGLDDWRTDLFFVAAHLDYLRRRYWRSQFSISFPRLRPCTGGLAPKSQMSDKELVQAIAVFRLFHPDLELSISTREAPLFREQLMPLGITAMSAFSSTQPGGYSKATDTALEQFAINDGRRPEEVEAAIRRIGYQPVWKNWDQSLSAMGLVR